MFLHVAGRRLGAAGCCMGMTTLAQATSTWSNCTDWTSIFALTSSMVSLLSTSSVIVLPVSVPTKILPRSGQDGEYIPSECCCRAAHPSVWSMDRVQALNNSVPSHGGVQYLPPRTDLQVASHKDEPMLFWSASSFVLNLHSKFWQTQVNRCAFALTLPMVSLCANVFTKICIPWSWRTRWRVDSSAIQLFNCVSLVVK